MIINDNGTYVVVVVSVFDVLINWLKKGLLYTGTLANAYNNKIVSNVLIMIQRIINCLDIKDLSGHNTISMAPNFISSNCAYAESIARLFHPMVTLF